MRISDWSSDVCSSDLNIDAVSLILGARRDAHGRAKQPIHLCYGSAEPLHLLDHLAAVACTRRRPPGCTVRHITATHAGVLRESAGIAAEAQPRTNSELALADGHDNSAYQHLFFDYRQNMICKTANHAPSHCISSLISPLSLAPAAVHRFEPSAI